MVDIVRKEATATSGGELSDGAQDIAGNKTFNNDITANGAITANGGLTAPDAPITSGSLRASSFTTVTGSPSSNADDGAFGTTDAGAGQTGLTIYSNSTQVGNLYFGDEGSPFAGQIYYNHTNDSMNFLTNAGSTTLSVDSIGVVNVGAGFSGGNASARLRVDSNGSGITSEFKTTSATGNGAAVIAWNSSSADNLSPPIWIAHGSLKSNNIRFAQFYATATTIPQTAQAGGIQSNNGAPSFYSDSDERVKNNITPYIKDTLADFDALNVVNYTYKDDPTDKVMLGVIAQQAKPLFPDMIEATDSGEGDEVPEGIIPWSVSSNWHYHLINAIKQLSDENKALKADIESLSTRLSALEA